MGAPKKSTEQSKKKRAPAKTMESREDQLIAQAVDLAEQQLSEGTASAMVITHFLKLASSRERLEKERLKMENELIKAKTEVLQSQKKQEELYAKAIIAMREYGGKPEETNEVDDIDN